MIPNNFFGAGNDYISHIGDGYGNNSYGNYLQYGNGFGYDTLIGTGSGSGSGSGVDYVYPANSGNGRGGGDVVLQTGNGDGYGDMPYFIGLGDSTDFKSVVMWAALIGGRS